MHKLIFLFLFVWGISHSGRCQQVAMDELPGLWVNSSNPKDSILILNEDTCLKLFVFAENQHPKTTKHGPVTYPDTQGNVYEFGYVQCWGCPVETYRIIHKTSVSMTLLFSKKHPPDHGHDHATENEQFLVTYVKLSEEFN